MPVGDDHERAVLSAAAAVVTTSDWARGRVARLARRDRGRPRGPTSRPWRRVRAPAVSCCASGPSSARRGRTSCWTRLPRSRTSTGAARSWGPSTSTPASSTTCATGLATVGIGDRVRFTGALAGTHLEDVYAGTDLLVSASRRESYGMSVTEALARGIPVVTTDVGGLPEAVGSAPDGSRPGLLFRARRLDCPGRPPRALARRRAAARAAPTLGCRAPRDPRLVGRDGPAGGGGAGRRTHRVLNHRGTPARVPDIAPPTDRSRHQQDVLDLGASPRRRRDPGCPRVAAGRRPVRGRAATDEPGGAAGGARGHGRHDPLLRLAVEPGRATSRRRRTRPRRHSLPTTGRSSSTPPCPAGSSATCTAA